MWQDVLPEPEIFDALCCMPRVSRAKGEGESEGFQGTAISAILSMPLLDDLDAVLDLSDVEAPPPSGSGTKAEGVKDINHL